MLTIRFRLRSVMILVALIAGGLWVAITEARVCAAMVMLSSESVVVVQPAYVIMVLAVVAALSLIAVGVISHVGISSRTAVVQLILCKRLVEHHRQPHTRLVEPLAQNWQVRVEVCIRQFLTRLQALAALGHLVGSPGG